MAKDKYSYPPDEFDHVTTAGRPVGAHELPRTTWSKVWPFLVVIVVVPILAFAAVKYLANDTGTPGDDGRATRAATSTDGATGTGDGQSGDPTGEQTDGQTPSEEPTVTESSAAPDEGVDRSTAVVVYNASGIQGIAGKVGDLLKADNFTDVEATDYTGTKNQLTTVYYSTPDQKKTARWVAFDVGSAAGSNPLVMDPEEAKGGIAVVVCTDYKPTT